MVRDLPMTRKVPSHHHAQPTQMEINKAHELLISMEFSFKNLIDGYAMVGVTLWSSSPSTNAHCMYLNGCVA